MLCLPYVMKFFVRDTLEKYNKISSEQSCLLKILTNHQATKILLNLKLIEKKIFCVVAGIKNLQN